MVDAHNIQKHVDGFLVFRKVNLAFSVVSYAIEKSMRSQAPLVVPAT